MIPRLLAKSPCYGTEVSIPEHSLAVLQAVRSIFGHEVPTPLATTWLSFFGLSDGVYTDFIRTLSLAAVLHDTGKANNGFQNAIARNGEQVIRHEHLSALILWLPEMRLWLEKQEYEMLLSAILCHHLKVDDTDHFLQPLVLRDSFHLYSSHADFIETLMLAEPFAGRPPDLSAYDREWQFSKLDGENLKKHLYNSGKKLRKDTGYRNLFLAIKSALIAADSAASALVREGMNLEDWIRDSLQQSPLMPDDIDKMVISPRIRQVEVSSGREFAPRTFQTEAGKLGPRALLLAGCGAGKTLAAWYWVRNQSRSTRFSRVLFLYPTRATATEGFRDYVSWAGEEDGALLHGTSGYDLTGMFTNPADSRTGQDYSTEQRLYALGFWPKRVFSATVDSILSFMNHSYASLCMLPVLADAAVVIDEVHSFDRSMFTSLEQFLKAFPSVPVLCMTASLTSDRQDILTERCGLELFPSDDIADLKLQTGAPRYTVSLCNDSPMAEIYSHLAEGRRILQVVNTVERCQKAYESMQDYCGRHGIPIICYHSRYKLADRKDKHESVIRLFRETKGAALVITTQVCEMSLDLDADVLVTEMAPVPSLIQRMGRCCRVELPGDRRGMVLVCEPENERPYIRQEIAQCRDFVKSMAVRSEVSQDDLAGYLAQMDVANPQIEGHFTGFLKSGWYAMASEESFRDTLDFTVECILDSDIELFKTYRRTQPDRIAGLVVPVPKKSAVFENRLGNRFPVADSRHYSQDSGFHAAR